MEVYRITLSKYADTLIAPGTEGRWNSRGRYVIYTAGSKSLACLENLVHRDSEGLKSNFSVLIIRIPEQLKIATIQEKDLPGDWTKMKMAHHTRKIGNEWLQSLKTPILKVPSAIISGENNYLINPAHPHFEKIGIVGKHVFEFDSRLKG